jgi:site-specific recombinase XerD
MYKNMNTEENKNSQESKNYVERAIEEVEGFGTLYHRFRRGLSILGRSESTIENYGYHVAAISLHFGRTPLDLDEDEVQEYLYELQNRSKTPSQSYFKHTIYGLRSLLKNEGLAYDYLLLPSIKKEKKLPVVLSQEEVWRMLLTANLLKHRILIGMLYGCGLRCFEVRNVRLQDLDFDREQLHVVQGKGKKDRYVPLSKHLIRGLKDYIAKENPQYWLFNGKPEEGFAGVSDNQYSQRGVQSAVKQAAEQAGISKNVSPHTLRHSFATHLLEDGLDIITIKNLLGHSRIQTTMEYLHVARINPQRAFSPLDTLFEQCGKKQK